MRVLTAYSQGRGVSPNLDRAVATDAWAAVLDGVTPKSDDMVSTRSSSSTR